MSKLIDPRISGRRPRVAAVGSNAGKPCERTPNALDSRAAACSAYKGCAERLFIVYLVQTGGSRVMTLARPAYPRSKDTGDHNLPEKRRPATSASQTLRKTRVVWSKLHRFKSNPDRGKRG